MTETEPIEELRNLYDSFRTALMNRKYYGRRLASLQKLSRSFDVIIAIGSSSAIAAWAIWRTSYGDTVWAILAGASTALAVLKPALKLSDQVERYSKLFAGYSDVAFDLESLVMEVRAEKKFDRPKRVAFLKAVDRLRHLSPQDDPDPNQSLLQVSYQEVNEQFPLSQFWIPKETEK